MTIRLRSTMSGTAELPEMQTTAPQPECIRTPKAAFFMLTEDTPTAFRIQLILERSVAKGYRGRCATDFDRAPGRVSHREPRGFHLLVDVAGSREHDLKAIHFENTVALVP